MDMVRYRLALSASTCCLEQSCGIMEQDEADELNANNGACFAFEAMCYNNYGGLRKLCFHALW